METFKKVFLVIVLVMFYYSVSGQTMNDLRPTVSMKEYVDMQSDLNSKMMQKIIDIQIQNINDNVIRANMAMEKRLDGINEFRGQLKDQAGTFVTRSELIAWIGMALGLFFGFSRYLRDKQDSTGKNIVSGDKVEVKK